MRVFMPTKEFECRDDRGHIVAVYLPGLRYYCDESNQFLSHSLDQWLADGRVLLIENKPGTRMNGHGEVR